MRLVRNKDYTYNLNDRGNDVPISIVVNGYYMEKRLLHLGLIISLSFLFAYGNAIIMMVSQWWYDDVYSYCFIIPFISSYLVWIRRDVLRQITPSPAYIFGTIILLSGLLMLIVGHTADIPALQSVSLIPSIVGLVVLILGFKFLKALRLPIAYLLFMLPVWEVVTDRLQFPFQNISAEIGIYILQYIGISAYRHGVYIELPNINLEVARECSGVNYLISVIAIGIPLSYLFLNGWLRRSLLLIFSVLVTIISNGFRIALIGTLSYYGISGDLHGPYHVLQGLVVSFFGYGAIFLSLWILSRNMPSQSKVQVTKSHAPPQIPAGKLSLRYIVFPIFILITAGLYIHFYRPIPAPLNVPLKFFPDRINKWKGMDTNFDENLIGSLKADDLLSRVYQSPSGRKIFLYIGYFESQRGERKPIRFNYETKKLHRDASEVEVSLDSNQSVKIKKVMHRHNGSDTLIHFWYDINDVIISDMFSAKVHTSWSYLRHRRNNGAVIIIASPLEDANEINDALSDQRKFIKDIFPLMSRHLPNYNRHTD